MGIYRRYVFPRLCDVVLGQVRITELRRDLLASVSGSILEIGFGTGLNLACYPASVAHLTTVDPNPGMHALARHRWRRSAIAVEHHQLGGERLPFVDAAFDTVVSTFTLCSIAKVEKALAEVWRVLKPGGRFLFLEHGLSPEPRVQRWQRRLNWLEMRLADGCRLDRDLRTLIAAQPFARARVDNFYLPMAPKTHGYLYRGVGVK